MHRCNCLKTIITSFSSSDVLSFNPRHHKGLLRHTKTRFKQPKLKRRSLRLHGRKKCFKQDPPSFCYQDLTEQGKRVRLNRNLVCVPLEVPSRPSHARSELLRVAIPTKNTRHHAQAFMEPTSNCSSNHWKVMAIDISPSIPAGPRVVENYAEYVSALDANPQTSSSKCGDEVQQLACQRFQFQDQNPSKDQLRSPKHHLQMFQTSA